MEGAGDVMQEERMLRRVIRGAAPSLCRPLGRAIGERTLVGSGESEGVEGGTADVAGGAGREMARCRFAVRVVDEV